MTIDSQQSAALTYQRSKTVLLIVHQEEDVAPAAAMCSLMGDLYRHRTSFNKEPMVVLRLAVTSTLRHHFVEEEELVTWRAHESSSRNARWITHVGAPDSIWILEEKSGTRDSNGNKRVMGGLLEAFRGQPTASFNERISKKSFLSHDDGGMADMILMGSSSSLTMTMWDQLARLTTNCSSNDQEYHSDAPPLVIATLGSLRGQDWLSRMAFATTSSSPIAGNRKRPLALVGFPQLLWNCRLVPTNQSFNAKKVKTTLTQENSIVLMMGRDSSSTAKQDVCFISTTNQTATLQQDQVLQLLRQTLFTPKTELKIMLPPGAGKTLNTASIGSSSAKLSLYNLIWSLLQDPHIIQFPCYMAIHQHSSAISQQQPNQQSELQASKPLGALILSVLEEILAVLHTVHKELCSSTITKGKNDGVDEIFCESMMHPLEKSILAKLLGTGGVLLEDLSNNRMTELSIRLRSFGHDQQQSQRTLVHQRWILEPLMTKQAMSEWHCITHRSPYPLTDPTADPVLMRQLQRDCVDYGLGVVLQLGQLLGMEQDRLATLQWVIQRAQSTIPSFIFTVKGSSSAFPLSAWNIHTMADLRHFLNRHHSLGSTTPSAHPLRSKL